MEKESGKHSDLDAEVWTNADATEGILNAYDVTLKKQHAMALSYKNAVKNFSNSLRFSIGALSDLQEKMLAIYEEDWDFYQDFRVCSEDELTVWQNYQRDILGITSLFRKYEDNFEAIEAEVLQRNKLLKDLKHLKGSIENLKSSKDPQHFASLHKIEAEYHAIEREIFKGHNALMKAFPKYFGRRVECLYVICEVSARITKEFCSEIQQVHQARLDILVQLPSTSPRIVVGGVEPCEKIEFLIHESMSAHRPKPKKPIVIKLADDMFNTINGC